MNLANTIDGLPSMGSSLLASVTWWGRNWAFLAIAVTCVSLLLFVILILRKYVRICLNIFLDTPPPLSMGPVDFQPLFGQEVRFRSFDGTSLRGMMLETPDRTNVKGVIVFCHEYGSDMYSCARYTRPLVDAGFDVFTFDFRAHGKSSGRGKYKPVQWPSDREMEDVLGACAYVESYLVHQGRPAELGLLGVSRGAGAGLLAAASDTNIRAIVCDSAFSTDSTLIALMKRWAKVFARVKLVYENHPEFFWRFLLWCLMVPAQAKLRRRFPSVRKALRDMQSRPVLFIHGLRDSYIRETHTRELYEAAPSPKYLWLVEDAKHNQSVTVEPAQYAARTIAFFQKHLAGEEIPEAAITCPQDAEVA